MILVFCTRNIVPAQSWLSIHDCQRNGKWSRSVMSDSLRPHGHQSPPSSGFSRQGYWSGLPFSSPGNFPTQGLNPGLPHCRQTLYHLSHQGRAIKGMEEMIKVNWPYSLSTSLGPGTVLSTLHASMSLSPCDKWAAGNRWGNRGLEKSGKLSKFPLLVSAEPRWYSRVRSPTVAQLTKSKMYPTLLFSQSSAWLEVEAHVTRRASLSTVILLQGHLRDWRHFPSMDLGDFIWYCISWKSGPAVAMVTESSCSQTHFLWSDNPFSIVRAGNKSGNLLWCGCCQGWWFYLDLHLIFSFFLFTLQLN